MFKHLNLGLAILWVVLGGGILAVDFIRGETSVPVYLLGNISIGWPCLVLATYNLARWLAGRGTNTTPRGPVNPLRVPRREGETEPDPAFDFSDRPPQPPPTPSVN